MTDLFSFNFSLIVPSFDVLVTVKCLKFCVFLIVHIAVFGITCSGQDDLKKLQERRTIIKSHTPKRALIRIPIQRMSSLLVLSARSRTRTFCCEGSRRDCQARLQSKAEIKLPELLSTLNAAFSCMSGRIDCYIRVCFCPYHYLPLSTHSTTPWLSEEIQSRRKIADISVIHFKPSLSYLTCYYPKDCK